MSEDFTMRPELKVQEEFTYFNQNGEVTNEEDALMYEYVCGEQSKYFIKTFDGQLYNPNRAVPQRHLREIYTKVSESVFDTYLEFLANPNEGKYNAVNRLVVYALDK